MLTEQARMIQALISKVESAPILTSNYSFFAKQRQLDLQLCAMIVCKQARSLRKRRQSAKQVFVFSCQKKGSWKSWLQEVKENGEVHSFPEKCLICMFI